MMCLISIMAFSQSAEISGRVTNEEGEGVPFANVSLKSDGEIVRVVPTDMDGYYVMKPVTPGEYSLSISTIEYSDMNYEEIVVSNGQIRTLNVKMGIAMMDEFVVSGTRHDIINTGFAGEVDVIDYREIEKLPLDPADVPALTAGAYQSDAGRPIQFRGARPEATQYMIDGMRIVGNNPYILRNSVDQMQIYTGGIPAKYGDATGGVVVIETKGYKLKMY